MKEKFKINYIMGFSTGLFFSEFWRVVVIGKEKFLKFSDDLAWDKKESYFLLIIIALMHLMFLSVYYLERRHKRYTNLFGAKDE